MMLVGCSRPNPFFELLSDGGSGGATEPMAMTQSAGAESGTGEGSSSDETGGAASTSEAVGSSTSDAASSTSGEASSTSGAAGTSSGGESSSGGEPEELVAYDLWELCPMAVWSAEGEKNVPGLGCTVNMQSPAPWAGWQSGVVFEGMAEPKVLALVPYPGLENLVTGRYGGLVMDGANTPRLRSLLLCPGPGTCEIKAVAWVEAGANNEVKAYQTVDLLATGEHVLFDVDLEVVNDGEPFDVVLQVTAKSAAPSTRGLWLRPRIVVSPGP